MNELQLLVKFKQLIIQYINEQSLSTITRKDIIEAFANLQSPTGQDSINLTILLNILDIITKEWDIIPSAIAWNDIN